MHKTESIENGMYFDVRMWIFVPIVSYRIVVERCVYILYRNNNNEKKIVLFDENVNNTFV